MDIFEALHAIQSFRLIKQEVCEGQLEIIDELEHVRRLLPYATRMEQDGAVRSIERTFASLHLRLGLIAFHADRGMPTETLKVEDEEASDGE